MKILWFITLPFLAYAIGSIPWGLIFTRAFTPVDIRAQGSGNIGATNVRRTAGTFWGGMTLAGDMLKGGIPTYLALGMGGDIYVSLVALCAFSGHLYPLYMGFKNGGKGVATAVGCILVVSPGSAAAALLVFILFICMFSRVSAGSLAGAAILPLAVWKATGSMALTGCASVMAGWIWVRHRENIIRIIKGTEPRL
jgi:glycerol-3-phosphate acyltransferase PlsY